MKVTAVILAAGHGKRMNSALPKVLHPLARRPMIHYSIDNAAAASTETPVVVVGHGAEDVQAEVGSKARFAIQAEQLGTAHALASAQAAVGQTDLILLVTADMPLLTVETLRRIVAAQAENSGPITLLTVTYADPRGFGRVIRDASGHAVAIVEEAQASTEQLAIRELNASVYAFDAQWLWPALKKIKKSPKGEYYLTDVVAVAVTEALTVQAIETHDADETIGINTRAYLAEAEAILRRRINQCWMERGVTLVDPATTYIEPDVEIGPDTVIFPATHLRDAARIGAGCVIGPNTIISATNVGNSCTIISSVLEGGVIQEGAQVGPFTHLHSEAPLTSKKPDGRG